MKSLNPSDCNDSSSINNPLNSVENHMNNPCINTRRSCSKGPYQAQFPNTSSNIRKQQLSNQTLYHFVPINDSQISGSNYTTNEVNAGDPQLPHYVVPVLYVPQRIITNEELQGSDILEKVCQDIPNEQFFQNATPVSQRNLPPNKVIGTKKLTDSETEIYEKLMKRMYGVKNPESDLDLQGDYNRNHSSFSFQTSRLNNPAPENAPNQKCMGAEPDYHNSTYDCSSDSENSSISMPIRRRPITVPSFNQDYATRPSFEPPSFISSVSSYTVHPLRQPDYDAHRLDFRMTNLGSPIKPRNVNTSHFAKRNYREPLMNSSGVPKTSSTEKVVYTMDFSFEDENLGSKCTQTKTDMCISTQTSDQSVTTEFCGNVQNPEKELTKNKIKDNESGFPAVVDKVSKEDVSTSVDESNYNKNSKSSKSTESIATVDLLPVVSSTFNPLESIPETIMNIPKLRTHSPYSSSKQPRNPVAPRTPSSSCGRRKKTT